MRYPSDTVRYRTSRRRNPNDLRGIRMSRPGTIRLLKIAAIFLVFGLLVVVMDIGIIAIYTWDGHLDFPRLERYSGWLPGGEGWPGRFSRLSVIVLGKYKLGFLLAWAMSSILIIVPYLVSRMAGMRDARSMILSGIGGALLNIFLMFMFVPEFFIHARMFHVLDLQIRYGWGGILTAISLLTLFLGTALSLPVFAVSVLRRVFLPKQT